MPERLQTWSGLASWSVLETEFGDGTGFLSQWSDWLTDPERPLRLHHVALTAAPPGLEALLHLIASTPGLAPLCASIPALQTQWRGLLPGWHRLELAGGQLLLTLCVRDAGEPLSQTLRELDVTADEIWLFGAEAHHAENGVLPALAACCRTGTPLLAPAAPLALAEAQIKSLGPDLARLGFHAPAPLPGVTSDRFALAVYQPGWNPRRPARAIRTVAEVGHCVVIGGGLAGASTACSLARRGWQVTVMDRSETPAAGASGLPAGLIAPHVSADDRALSRLTRAGVRATVQRARDLLREGVEWQVSGVLERRMKDGGDLPTAWLTADSPGADWSRPAVAVQLAQAGLAAADAAHWHAMAGWLRPARLVCAMLTQPGIRWLGGQSVTGLQRLIGESPSPVTGHARWAVLGGQGQRLAGADLVVVAAGYDTLALLAAAGAPPLPLNPLRGQVAWGLMPDTRGDGSTQALPPFPVNGLGSLICGVEINGAPAWITGSTFERGNSLAQIRAEDAEVNHTRLQTLLPGAGAALQPQFDAGAVQAWAAVRCTVPDRLPVVGAVDPQQLPGLLCCTAMGARGLTLAVLCGELLVAQLHGEPLPLPRKLTVMLAPQRWVDTGGNLTGIKNP